MSKLSFRARALDPSKPLPIYLAEELPDLPEYSAINRAVPQMPSGMEKEEESEHHLQRAICTGLIIPTPEVFQTDPEFYDRNYPKDYKMPRQLIHMQPFSMEQDIPDYDMDSADELWVNSRLDLNPYKFEQMMDRLEKSSGQTVITLNEAKALLKQDDEISIAVYDYWLNKRLKTQHPLILSVKTENRGGQTTNNPYLAFRRRTEKMQTRKNRKNDEASYEKMLKLRRDLSRAVTLLEMIKRREKAKREHMHLSIEVFEKRYQYPGNHHHHHHHSQMFGGVKNELDMSINMIANSSGSSRKEKRQYKKRKHKYIPRSAQGSSSAAAGSSIPGGGGDSVVSSEDEDLLYSLSHGGTPESEDEGLYTFRRNLNCQYKKPIQNGVGAWARASRARMFCPEYRCGGGDSVVSSEDEDLLYSLSHGGTPESEDEGLYTFRRNLNCQYKKPIQNGVGAWARASRARMFCPEYRCKFTLGALRSHGRGDFIRRRVGRGGRIVIDRLTSDIDDVWSKLDYTIFDSWQAQKEADQPIVVKIEDVENRSEETVCNGAQEVAVLKKESDTVTNHVNSESECERLEWCDQDIQDYNDIVPQNVREMMRTGEFTQDSLPCYRPMSLDIRSHTMTPVAELEERDYQVEIQAIEDRSLPCDLLLSDSIFYPSSLNFDDLSSTIDLTMDRDLALSALTDDLPDSVPETTVGCSQFTVTDVSGPQKVHETPSKAAATGLRTFQSVSTADRMETEQTIADTSNDSDDVPLVAYQIESQAAAAAAAAATIGSSPSTSAIVLGLPTSSRGVLNGSNESKNVVARSRSLFHATSSSGGGGGQPSMMTLTQAQPQIFLTHQPIFQGTNKGAMCVTTSPQQKVMVAQAKSRYSTLGSAASGAGMKANSMGIGIKSSQQSDGGTSTTIGHLTTTADGKITTIKSQPARGLNMVIDMERKRIMYANLKNSNVAVTTGQQFVTQINPRMVNIVPIQQIKTQGELQGVQPGASGSASVVTAATVSPTSVNSSANTGR
uniref:Enhancer of polycomb-like protein n=1 Tax=Lutzomyia longipalpis TaxID=7200 RepID=A0A1B0CWI6_LUTLO